MSDKLKTVADATAPIVEVVAGGAKAAVGAPVVVETGEAAVDVLVEFADKAPMNKKILVAGAAALVIAGLAGGVAFWASRRKNALSVDEVAEQVAHKVVEAETVAETKKIK